MNRHEDQLNRALSTLGEPTAESRRTPGDFFSATPPPPRATYHPQRTPALRTTTPRPHLYTARIRQRSASPFGDWS